MTTPLLALDGLKVKYGNVEALHGISLTVKQGEIVTILGANGAGKSTTLRAISGLLKPSAGEIHFDGRPAHGIPAHERVKLGISQAPEGRRSPRDAEGSIPMDPVSTAPSSLRISPNIFSVSTISNRFGLSTSCMAQLSTKMCSSSIPA